MDFQVIPVSVDSATALSQVATRLFLETYGLADTHPLPDHVDEYIESNLSANVQMKELNDTGVYTYMVYEQVGNMPIAYCQLRDQKHDNDDVIDDPNAVELRRLYIDQRYHGVGIGRRLILQSIAKAKELGKKTIWLYVWVNNSNAIGFYERQGFHKAGTRHFMMGDFEAANHIMIKNIE
ncbi:acyl-CoA N-acyltransferase [Lichtheimia hyalospora FSU 10163]|nr:acyl-CoA N-acyltransferase [Lichtheimia hyalospora FSU 10163]